MITFEDVQKTFDHLRAKRRDDPTYVCSFKEYKLLKKAEENKKLLIEAIVKNVMERK